MSIIIMLILLSILILVHEAGHYLAARMFGMKVDKFGFGLPIGPTLWEKQCGDTKILVHAFLLGGYVAFPDDDKDNPLPEDSPDRFLNRPIYQRFIVVSAGVFANVVCAFVLVLLTAFLWGHMPSGKYDIYVKNIVANKTASVWNSGLAKGDKIVSINGSPADSAAALTMFARQSKAFDGKVDTELVEQNVEELKKLNVAFKRDEIIPAGVTIRLPELKYEKEVSLTDKMLIGMEKYEDSQVTISDKQAALRDKLIGKKLYTSDGTVTIEDVAYAYSDNYRPVRIKVFRNNQVIDLKPIYPDKDGVIGVEMEAREIVIPTKSPKSAIVASGKYLYEQTYLLLYGLWQIFSGKIPLKDLHGIVAITKVGGDIIQHNGIFSGLLLTAVISLDLAIVNFLPIPALDGGHVLFLIIEKLRGRPLDEETVNKIGTAGFLFLIVLMIIVVFNDIYALVMQKL